jgi:hypothetical protein
VTMDKATSITLEELDKAREYYAKRSVEDPEGVKALKKAIKNMGSEQWDERRAFALVLHRLKAVADEPHEAAMKLCCKSFKEFQKSDFLDQCVFLKYTMAARTLLDDALDLFSRLAVAAGGIGNLREALHPQM